MQSINDSREIIASSETRELIFDNTKSLVDQMKQAITSLPPETWVGCRLDVIGQGESRRFHSNGVLAEIIAPVLHVSITNEGKS